jgi:hypothetical protein
MIFFVLADDVKEIEGEDDDAAAAVKIQVNKSFRL